MDGPKRKRKRERERERESHTRAFSSQQPLCALPLSLSPSSSCQPRAFALLWAARPVRAPFLPSFLSRVLKANSTRRRRPAPSDPLSCLRVTRVVRACPARNEMGPFLWQCAELLYGLREWVESSGTDGRTDGTLHEKRAARGICLGSVGEALLTQCGGRRGFCGHCHFGQKRGLAERFPLHVHLQEGPLLADIN